MTPHVRIPVIPDVELPGLKDRHVVVIGGAGGGVGTAVVAMLAHANATVLLIDHAADRVQSLMRHFPGTIEPLITDITDPDAAALVDQRLRDRPATALINAVGGVTPDGIAHFLDISAEQWRSSMATNCDYAVRSCQVFARRLAATGQPGSIVNLSVADARTAMPWFASYAASRSALESATRNMAVELGPLGIRANTVAWGLVDSPRAHSGAGSDGERERRLIPLGRRGQAAEVASVVLFLISDLGSYVTGQAIAVDGGLSLRAGHYGPQHNIPEFLEISEARDRLRADYDRITGPATSTAIASTTRIPPAG